MVIPSSLCSKEVHQGHLDIVKMKNLARMMVRWLKLDADIKEMVEKCSQWEKRMIILPSLRSKVLEELHQGHSDIVEMKSLARMMVWWPKLDAGIKEMVKKWSQCQSVRVEDLNLWYICGNFQKRHGTVLICII